MPERSPRPASRNGTGASVTDLFRRTAAQRGFLPDAAQEAALARLQRLEDEFIAYKARRRTRLQRLVVHPPLPRGVYFWGGVGRGKSFLMDTFHAAVPVVRKTRMHFHEFMRGVHRDLETHKGETDPLRKVAAGIAKRFRLICFDEFHVSDIADAMILGRLLKELVGRRVVFCMTSNYRPGDLYPNGLQRERFLPVIELIERDLDIVNVDGGIDYRLRAFERLDCYLCPSTESAHGQLERVFRDVAGDTELSADWMLNGRVIAARKRAPGILWCDFETLCGGPRSQLDYLDIARECHTVLVSDVPRMGPDAASAARRFTWLVDILYDHRVKLLLSAEVPPESLYTQGINSEEFSRTVSRLREMQTRDYLASPHLTSLRG